MGAATSSPSRPAAPLLDYHEALRLATERRGVCVKVRAACASVGDGVFDPALRIEWIDLDLQSTPSPKVLSQLGDARAMVAVWFALSCCPGYGEDENPVFWHDALFNNTVERWPHAVSSLRFTSTANRAERPFPRVRITPAPGFEGITLATFLGAFQPDKRLCEVLVALRPFICANRWRSLWIDVAACGVDTRSVLNVLMDVRMQRDLDDDESVLFKLAAVYFQDEDDDRVQLVASSVDADLYVDDVLKHPSTRQLRCTKRLPALLSSQHLRLDYRVAALPHSRVIQSLHLQSTFGRRAEAFEAAWLGYAMFHPEVELHGTSFSQLKTALSTPLLGSIINALRLMSVGNNLLYIMGKADSPSTGYTQVKLRAGTVVRSNHPDDNREVDVIFDQETWVTSCEASNDMSSLRSQLFVVIPGFGIQQIKKIDILECSTRNPSRACVKQLHLTCDDVEVSANSEFLEVFQGSLTIVEVKRLGGFSSWTVLSILRACPQLRSLSISHDGSCWSSEEAILNLPDLPGLEILELHIRSSLPQPLCAPQLCFMKVLRIHTEQLLRFDRHREVAEAMFAHFPRLQTIACGSRLDIDINATSEPSGMSTLGPQVCDVALSPLKIEARIAFLSVIGDKSRSTSSMYHLSRDEIALIFDFSSTEVPRRFVFQNF